jgi:hypothetical protein
MEPRSSSIFTTLYWRYDTKKHCRTQEATLVSRGCALLYLAVSMKGAAPGNISIFGNAALDRREQIMKYRIVANKIERDKFV